VAKIKINVKNVFYIYVSKNYKIPTRDLVAIGYRVRHAFVFFIKKFNPIQPSPEMDPSRDMPCAWMETALQRVGGGEGKGRKGIREEWRGST